VVELTDSGRELVGRIKTLWVTLAEETVRGLPAETLSHLPAVLHTMSTNVSGRPSA
jgi:hypothetical protein